MPAAAKFEHGTGFKVTTCLPTVSFLGVATSSAGWRPGAGAADLVKPARSPAPGHGWDRAGSGTARGRVCAPGEHDTGSDVAC